tara:strand:+ start:306 stop:569 length:264 start_codon:yes stop_codon:yes gene_type:complete
MAAMEPPRIEGVRGIMVHAGLATPISRAFVVGTVVGIGAYALKMPTASFDEKGEMRPLSLVSKAPTATMSHFLAVPLGAAILAYVFT